MEKNIIDKPGWLKTLQKIPFGLIIKIIITVVLFWGIFSKTDIVKIVETISQISLLSLGLMVGGFWIIQIAIAARWRFILQAQNQHVPLISLIKAVFIGHLFNQGLPSSIGGDLYRIMALHQHHIPLGTSLSSVLFERLIGFLGLGLLCFICTPLEWAAIHNTALFWPVILSLSLFIGITIGLVIVHNFTQRWITFLPFGKKIQPFIDLVQNIVQYRHYLIPAVIISGFISILSILNCLVLLNGLSLELTFSQAYLIFPVVFILSSLPISLGGWGVREGLMMIAFQTFGIAGEIALAFSLLYGFIQLLSAIPGIFFWMYAPHNGQS